MEAVSIVEGSCHCGAIGFAFRASLPPESWRIRACQCSFCRSHDARTTTDPAGSVEFLLRDLAQLQRYRFGLATADFLLCRRCGVYLGAVLTSPRGRFATLNVNAVTAPIVFPAAEPRVYDEESAEQRLLRRERLWTPVTGPF